MNQDTVVVHAIVLWLQTAANVMIIVDNVLANLALLDHNVIAVYLAIGIMDRTVANTANVTPNIHAVWVVMLKLVSVSVCPVLLVKNVIVVRIDGY